MKMIGKILIAVAMMATCDQINAQNDMVLTTRQQGLVAIAALEAKGDLPQLAKAINTGLDDGLTANEVKEALSQLYAYTGFPRSLNALGTLQQVLKDREAQGVKTEQGRDADPLPADYDALRQGTDVQTQLSGKPFNYTFAPATDYYLKAHLFGDIFARNTLTHAERELVTVSAISALPGCEPQLKAHAAGALNMGVKRDELQAIPDVLAQRIGAEEAYRARQAVSTVLGLPFEEGRPVDFNVWPKGDLNTAYAKYFVGNSYLAPLDSKNGGPVNVTFEPGCRNNWHIHHKSVQVLICVSGRGWYQEWGKPAVAMTPGTVIAIPAEVKHWHGAAKDSWFQHLTYMTKVEDGASNEWLEAVDAQTYEGL
jgi:4-carboxymuconolactone decarboxylase